MPSHTQAKALLPLTQLVARMADAQRGLVPEGERDRSSFASTVRHVASTCEYPPTRVESFLSYRGRLSAAEDILVSHPDEMKQWIRAGEQRQQPASVMEFMRLALASSFAARMSEQDRRTYLAAHSEIARMYARSRRFLVRLNTRCVATREKLDRLLVQFDPTK